MGSLPTFSGTRLSRLLVGFDVRFANDLLHSVFVPFAGVHGDCAGTDENGLEQNDPNPCSALEPASPDGEQKPPRHGWQQDGECQG